MNGPSLRPIGPSARRQCVSVKVGHVTIGGGSPIVVQSMTNTDTADVTSTAEQVAQLARAGSEIVRITVDRREAAAAVPYIRDELERKGLNVPLVGDFHYIGHRLLTEFPACAKALAKCLEVNRSLRTLILTANEISDEGALAFDAALAINHTLKLLDLRCTHLSRSTRDVLEARAASRGDDDLGPKLMIRL